VRNTNRKLNCSDRPIARTQTVVIKIFLAIIGIFVLLQVVIRVFRKLYHFPAPAFIGRILDSGRRRRLQPPHKVIERSGIREGMRVLDLGN
jgi:hypothetical protein